MPREKARAVCKFFTNSCCSQGDNCRFLHPVDIPTVRNNICKNFVIATQDGCSFGDRCRFIHLPCESGFQCSDCKTRVFIGNCMACRNRHLIGSRQHPQTFHGSNQQTRKLQFALVEEKDRLTTAMSEMNAILDSLETDEAQTQTAALEIHQCGVCYDRKISHALVPCGHCFCLVCIESSGRCCPICRDVPENLLAIYL